MPDSLRDHLIVRAERFWREGRRLPTDLFTSMLIEGLDVDALERQFQSTKESN